MASLGNLGTGPDPPNGRKKLLSVPYTRQGRQAVPLIDVFYQVTQSSVTEIGYAVKNRRRFSGAFGRRRWPAPFALVTAAPEREHIVGRQNVGRVR
jgi:hypothetical protein